MSIETLQRDFNQIKRQFEVELKKVSKDPKKQVEVYRKQFELKVKSLTDEAQKAALEQIEKRKLKPLAEALLQRAQYVRDQFEKDPLLALKNIKKILKEPLKPMSAKAEAKASASVKLAKKARKAPTKKSKRKTEVH